MASQKEQQSSSSIGDIVNTTPGQLQDVTMDNSYSYGFRSPAFGQGSPSQTRSVRDYEEQITAQQRENFNLKLRIYFLEEKLNGSALGQGTESLFKQNVDLKVEIEAQKRELQEKHELLTQAASAMKYMEDSQKVLEEEAKATETELKSRIDLLELEISEMQKIYGPMSPKTNLISLVEGDTSCGQLRVSDGGFLGEQGVTELHELHGRIDQLTSMNGEVTEALKHLEAMHQEKGLKIREYEAKNNELVAENLELKEKICNLDKGTKITEELKVQLFEVRKQLAEKLCDQQTLEASLQEKTKAYEKVCAVVQKLLNARNESTREQRKSDVSSQVSDDIESIEALRAQIANKDVEISNLRAEILRTVEQKNAEIYELKTEVKRKTTNLQNLINRDLWDKNREIERLTRQMHGMELESPVVSEVDQLHSQFTEAQYNEAVEKNVLLQRKLDELRQKVCHNPNDKILSDLQQELHAAQIEAENEKKLRKECADVCSILTLRLEELAGFLDSLLKHKDVLGALCADRRHAMRKAIDRSLDLSRSINSSSLNLGLTFSENSLMEMTGVSGIFNESFPESVLNHSCNNKENVPVMREESYDSAKVIEALKAEVMTLRTELEKSYKRKEVEKKRPQRPDGHSESESWSEPDRNVSAARIGLEERAPKAGVKPYNSSTDDEDAEAGTPMKKTLAAEKIAQLELLITEKENKLLEMEMSCVERENVQKEEKLRVNEQLRGVQEELSAQKDANEQLSREISHLRNAMVDQENILSGIEELKSELQEKTEALEMLTKERDRIAVDLRVLEIEMETMRKDAEYIKERHGKELTYHVEKMRKEMEVEFEAQLQRKDLEQQEIVKRDFVTRAVLQEKQDEVDVLRRRLEDAQGTIDAMQEAEIELRALLAEYERRARDVQKSLDDATLQASRAVLERSRAVNVRGHLEASMKDLQGRCERLTAEKLELNGRIGQLEHVTATLQNQLVKATVKSGSSSPDLGIDSDIARASSSDAAATKAPPIKSPRLSTASTVEMKESPEQQMGQTMMMQQEILEENKELKKRLVRMKRQLEETVQRLKQSNKQKEQIERDIQMQILKTHSVLKQVRTNMESEAEKRNIPLPPRPSDGNKSPS
ncbi:centrosomin isoform X2 [Lutzomyia longipalpis]|uniref:centrosomin isoform X2 n=1 Tax=Lutzomyia longipalpis TaxID=7200 RepID=UPI002483D8A5|nr:centrosomin isoform X2 [Lutzomyia longipalpis]